MTTPMYDSLSEKEQRLVQKILEKRTEEDDLPEQLEGKAILEYLAHTYKDQLLAFDEVLTDQGYELTRKIPHAYAGKIAALSAYGTLTMMGQPERKDEHWIRTVTTSRIHSQYMTLKEMEGYIECNPRLGATLKIITPYDKRVNSYTSSALRGLAVNREGTKDLVLEHRETTIKLSHMLTGMGEKTMRALLRTPF